MCIKQGFIILLQSRGKWTTHHDSTIGVGTGFYWFGACVVIFLVIGTLKAFAEDGNWKGNVHKPNWKDRKKKK